MRAQCPHCEWSRLTRVALASRETPPPLRARTRPSCCKLIVWPGPRSFAASAFELFEEAVVDIKNRARFDARAHALEPAFPQKTLADTLKARRAQCPQNTEQLRFLNFVFRNRNDRRIGFRNRAGLGTFILSSATRFLMKLNPLQKKRTRLLVAQRRLRADCRQCPDPALGAVEQTFPHQILPSPCHLVVEPVLCFARAG